MADRFSLFKDDVGVADTIGVLRLDEQGSAPSADANVAKVYSKDSGGVTKVYILYSDGTEIEIGANTAGGTFVYDPGGTPSDTLFTTFSAAVAAANVVDGQKFLVLKADVTENDWTTSLSDIHLIGDVAANANGVCVMTFTGASNVPNDLPASLTNIEIDLNTSAAALFAVSDGNAHNLHTYGLCTFTSATNDRILRSLNGSHIHVYSHGPVVFNNSGTVAVVTTGDSLTWTFFDDVSGGADPFVANTGTPTLTLNVYSPIPIGIGFTFSGAGGTLVYNRYSSGLAAYTFSAAGTMELPSTIGGNRGLYARINTPGAPVTMSLPSSMGEESLADANERRTVVVDDYLGEAYFNPITIDVVGGGTINEEQTTYVLDRAHGIVEFLYIGNGDWVVISENDRAKTPDTHGHIREGLELLLSAQDKDSLRSASDNWIDLIGYRSFVNQGLITVVDGRVNFPGAGAQHLSETLTVAADPLSDGCIFDGGHTLSFWVRLESDTNANDGTVICQTDGGTHGWDLTHNGAGQFSLTQQFSTTDGVWEFIVFPTAYDIDVGGGWHHITLSYDSSNVANDPTFYINGALAQANETTAPVGSANVNASTLRIGDNFDSTQPFDGRVDLIAAYSRVLSASEVRQNFLRTARSEMAESQVNPLVVETTLTSSGNVTNIALLDADVFHIYTDEDTVITPTFGADDYFQYGRVVHVMVHKEDSNISVTFPALTFIGAGIPSQAEDFTIRITLTPYLAIGEVIDNAGAQGLTKSFTWTPELFFYLNGQSTSYDSTTGTVKDLIGGASGTLQVNAGVDDKGHFDFSAGSADGTCIQFGGAGSNYDPFDNAGAAGTGTISCWVYIESGTVTGNYFVWDNSSTLEGSDCWYDFDNDRLYFKSYNNTGTHGEWYVTAAVKDRWQHLAVTFDGTSTLNDPIIYVDGNPAPLTEAVTPGGVHKPALSAGLRIGGNGASAPLPGRVDGFAMYRGAILSQNQVLNMIRTEGIEYERSHEAFKLVTSSGNVTSLNHDAADSFYLIMDEDTEIQIPNVSGVQKVTLLVTDDGSSPSGLGYDLTFDSNIFILDNGSIPKGDSTSFVVHLMANGSGTGWIASFQWYNPVPNTDPIVDPIIREGLSFYASKNNATSYENTTPTLTELLSGEVGTVTGTVTLTDGRLTFDGVGTGDYYAWGGAGTDFDPFTSGGTFSIWIKPNANGDAGYKTIAAIGNTTQIDSQHEGWRIEINEFMQCLFEQAFSTTNGVWQFDTLSPFEDQWQLLTVVYDGSSTANDPLFYLNGELIGSTDITTPVGTSKPGQSHALRIGGNTGDTTFSGQLDNPVIYKAVKTQAEIAHNYRVTAHQYNQDTPLVQSYVSSTAGVLTLDADLFDIFVLSPTENVTSIVINGGYNGKQIKLFVAQSDPAYSISLSGHNVMSANAVDAIPNRLVTIDFIYEGTLWGCWIHSSVEGSDFYYDSGGTAGGNTFTDFYECVLAANRVPGQKRIIVSTSDTIPTGVYDFTDIELCTDVGSSRTLTWPTGATMSEIPARMTGIAFVTTSTAPLWTFAGSGTRRIYLQQSTLNYTGGSGTAMFDLSGSTGGIVLHLEHDSVLSGDLIYLGPSASTELYADHNSQISNGVLVAPASGTPTATMFLSGGTGFATQAVFTGGGGILDVYREGDFYDITETSSSTVTLAISGNTRLRMDTAGIAAASTVNLPADMGPRTTSGNRRVIIKDITGSAGTYPITIDANGAHTIDDALTLTLSHDYASVELYFDGTDNWEIVSLHTTPTVQTLTSSTNQVAWDANDGPEYKILNLGESTELQTPSNAVEGQRFTIAVEQDGTGGRQFTFATGFNDRGQLDVPDGADEIFHVDIVVRDYGSGLEYDYRIVHGVPIEGFTDIDARVTTTDATETTIAVFATTTDDAMYLVDVDILGIDKTADDVYQSHLRASVIRDATSAVTLKDVSVVSEYDSDVSWSTDIDVSGTSIRVRVTGDATNSTYWRAKGVAIEQS